MQAAACDIGDSWLLVLQHHTVAMHTVMPFEESCCRSFANRCYPQLRCHRRLGVLHMVQKWGRLAYQCFLHYMRTEESSSLFFCLCFTMSLHLLQLINIGGLLFSLFLCPPQFLFKFVLIWSMYYVACSFGDVISKLLHYTKGFFQILCNFIICGGVKTSGAATGAATGQGCEICCIKSLQFIEGIQNIFIFFLFPLNSFASIVAQSILRETHFIWHRTS